VRRIRRREEINRPKEMRIRKENKRIKKTRRSLQVEH
jgi:hypothetical protein